MNAYEEQELLRRIAAIEAKQDELLALYQQATGGIKVLQWIGAIGGSVVGLWMFLSDHIHWTR